MDFSESEIEPAEALLRALARAEDRLSRLDERVQASGFAPGWRRRADIRAVIADAWVQGDLVHPEDLILHALAMDTRIPDLAVIQANTHLRAREKAWRRGEELLSWAGVTWLLGDRRDPPPAAAGRPSLRVGPRGVGSGSVSALSPFFDELQRGVTDAPRTATEQCLAVLDVAAGAPPLLGAAALLEAWRLVEPFGGRRGYGGLLASLWLKARGRFSAGLFPIEVALRRRGPPARLARAPLLERLQFWLEVIEASADLELEEVNRLKLQRSRLERRVREVRKGAKAQAFLELALDYPVLTTELIARSLQVTPQAAGQILRRMDGVITEITGRDRYRVWRL